jgi:hypothetical protein
LGASDAVIARNSGAGAFPIHTPVVVSARAAIVAVSSDRRPSARTYNGVKGVLRTLIAIVAGQGRGADPAKLNGDRCIEVGLKGEGRSRVANLGRTECDGRSVVPVGRDKDNRLPERKTSAGDRAFKTQRAVATIGNSDFLGGLATDVHRAEADDGGGLEDLRLSKVQSGGVVAPQTEQQSQ